jgi:type II secretory pathway pseudopilin PulG
MRIPREIVLINRSETHEPDRWSKIERISKILAAIAIPVVLGVGGWVVQNQLQHQTAALQQQLQNQTVSKDYVQLAVSLLREPDKSKVTPELRAWAVDLLNAYSAVRLDDTTARNLKSGAIALPPLEKFSAVPSSASPELDKDLRPALESFQKYLNESGFKIAATGVVLYEVVPGDAISTESGEFYSLYDPDTRVLKVAKEHLGDFDLIRHEYMRHVLDPDYPGPRDPSKNRHWFDYYAVGSGMATYFVCSFGNTPVFAGNDPDVKSDLKNNRKLQHSTDDLSAEDIGSNAWGGAFWQLREEIGQASADKLLANAWASWRPVNPKADLFLQFVQQLIAIDESQSGSQHIRSIQSIFRQRGLKV